MTLALEVAPMSKPLPNCVQCERAHGWYGVEMMPVATTEPWRNGFKCPHGHVMAREGYDILPEPDAKPSPYDDWREVYADETSRTGRWVLQDASGGDATGESKPVVDMRKWMRRG